MKRRRWLVALLVVLGLFLSLFLFSGGEMGNPVGLAGYSVSEDGRSITLSVGVIGSMGYVRKVKTRAEGDGLYLTFYSTFGFNSPWGAKDTFTIDLPQGCRNIYFTSPAYSEPYPALTLSQESGRWEDPNHPPAKSK